MLKGQLQKALHFAKSKLTIAGKSLDKNIERRKSSGKALIYPIDEQLIKEKSQKTNQKSEKKQNKREENEEEQQDNNLFYSNFLIYHLT